MGDIRLPQHTNDEGGWCGGSGQMPHSGGGCRGEGCTARRGSLAKPGKRTDPEAVAEAAVAYQVRLLLAQGVLLPACAVTLRPEPEVIQVEHDGPFISVVVVGYRDGTEDRVWVSVEAEDRRTRRQGAGRG